MHTPKQLNSALIPTLQELLSKCRTCQQQRNSLQEQEAKERKTKGLLSLINVTQTKVLQTVTRFMCTLFSHHSRLGHFLASIPSTTQEVLFYYGAKILGNSMPKNVTHLGVCMA